jgi:hypothetical protein
MLADHLYLWPLAVAAGGAVVAAIRGIVLLVGLRWALRNGRKADTVTIYREFARAARPKGLSMSPSGRRESRKGFRDQCDEHPHVGEGESERAWSS